MSDISICSPTGLRDQTLENHLFVQKCKVLLFQDHVLANHGSLQRVLQVGLLTWYPP